MKNKLVLGLGSNLGNRYVYIYQATKLIESNLATKGKLSSIYTSPPWGISDQPAFLNAAFVLETENTIETCFRIIKNIETELGRVHIQRWGPRCIDIDILFFNDEVVETEYLSVPHKSIAERAFVLAPLVDLMPEYVHPVLTKSMATLLAEIENNCTRFY